MEIRYPVMVLDVIFPKTFTSPTMKLVAAALLIILIALSILKPTKQQQRPGLRTEQEPEQADGEDYFFAQHSFPYGKIDYAAQRNAAEAFRAARSTAVRDLTPWEFAGPQNVGGRIADVEMDPTDQDIAFIGAATGGIFKTTDGGDTWLPVFDEQTTMSIGDMAIAPSDHNTIYVGTGEANGGSGSLTYDANGVYKSTDGGASWLNVGLNETHMIGRVAVHPTDPDVVFVAAMGDMYGNTSDRGLYKTTDGGATWTQVLYVNDSTGAVDVVINPQNPDIVFACTWMRTRHPNRKDYAGYESGVWKSTDGGDTFTRLDDTNGLPATNIQFSRVGIDLCASSPNVIYCMYINQDYDFYGIYKSTDDGETWSETNDNALQGSMSGQGYWYGRVKCDPTNSSILYVIGFDTYKTTNGGNTYNLTFFGAHVDQHSVAVHPLQNTYVLLGNDGGLYYSLNNGNTYTKDYTLPITQVYRVGIDPSDVSHLYCGNQDNGTYFTPTGTLNDYLFIFGGDGFQSLVNAQDNQTVIAGYQYGNIYKSTDGGYNWDYATNGITGTANWNYPLTVDPQNANTIYTGTQRVFRSTNFGSSWTSISPELTQLDQTGTLIYGTITFIDVSPLNSNIIYAGTDNGSVWNTLDGGNNWTEVDDGLPVRWVTCVETDPFDEATAYVTISGYRFHDNMSHVYKTTDNGQTWNDIGATLPDVPCNCIIADPAAQDVLYLATDVGVYYSLDGGQNWNPAGTGMPVVPCVDLKLHEPTRTLVAGSYGRGMYKMNLDVLLGMKPLQPSTFAFSIYPNLFTGSSVQATITVPAATTASLTVFDMQGNILSEKSMHCLAGSHGLTIDPGNLPAGIYLLQLKAGERVAAVKVMKQ